MAMIRKNKAINTFNYNINRTSSSLNPQNGHPTSVEFPTSPQIILGEQMIHFGHPQHPIAKIDLPDQFTCSGCKEDGAGKRFICLHCDFQLHEFCALAPSFLKTHPFHYQHQLLFSSKPVKGGGITKSKCDICGKPSKGYNFRCTPCGFQMHPCCAMLSPHLKFSIHPHPLKLLPSTPSVANGLDHGFTCGVCKRKRSGGRVYRCTICEYHLHAVCAKRMVNGFEENGIDVGSEKSTMFGAAAKVASQVMIDFLGGLLEGLGQGVGEALLQGVVTRGGRGNRMTRNG